MTKKGLKIHPCHAAILEQNVKLSSEVVLCVTFLVQQILPSDALFQIIVIAEHESF